MLECTASNEREAAHLIRASSLGFAELGWNGHREDAGRASLYTSLSLFSRPRLEFTRSGFPDIPHQTQTISCNEKDILIVDSNAAYTLSVCDIAVEMRHACEKKKEGVGPRRCGASGDAGRHIGEDV